MHEVLLLGIAASELTVLLTSDPRRWSRRLSLFLTLLLAVICYAWFVLGVSALANALGATLAIVWFAWDLVDPSARGAWSLGVGIHRLCRAPECGANGISDAVAALGTFD